MLKHIYHSGSSITRGVSPAPSSSSISTEGSTSSSTSPRSTFSSGSEKSATLSTISSWRRLSESRASSRLSMSENPDAVPLRVYSAGLRPDIQYKTIGVTQHTTAKEVINAILTKCKVRFKDPRLFHLVMEIDIRGPNGSNTKASLTMEDSSFPLQLQECYSKGQTRFCLQMKTGSLVKIFDGSNTVGWQYKSILISEETTASELIDILFRYVIKNLSDNKYYTLHLELDAWKRQIEWDEAVIPAQNVAIKWGTPKLVLRCQSTHIPLSLLLGNSTTSLYDNVHTPVQVNSSLPHDVVSLNSSGVSTTGSTGSTSSSDSVGRDYRRTRGIRRCRSKSLSEYPTEGLMRFHEQSQNASSSSSTILHHTYQPSLTDSITAKFAKLNTKYGKYELSEAFFV